MKKRLKRFCCFMGWHSYFVGFTRISNDSVNNYVECKWCSKKGMLDSQGNIF